VQLPLVVNPALVAHHQNQYEDLFVLDLADDTVCTDAVLPATGKLLSQRGAEAAGILICADLFPKVTDDFRLNLVVGFYSVVKSPSMAFYSAESEKCHFHFPHKSITCGASH